MRYANQKKATIDKLDVKNRQHMGLDFDTLSMALKKLKTTSGYNLYFYLAKNAPDYEFFYSPAHIEEFTGMSKSSISKAKKELIDLGFIEETESEIIFHARSIHDSFPQETKVSDEKQNEKMECFSQETNSFSQETKNFPQETNSFSQETNSFSQETIVSHSTVVIDNNNNNNRKIDKIEQSIVLNERLEAIANQFSNGEAARKSFKQLLDSGKTEEWIAAAVNNKKKEVFEKYGFGLLFKAEYQQEIDSLLAKKKHDAAAAEEWRKAMFEQGSQNLTKQAIVINVATNKTESKPKRKNRLELIDLNEIANMA